MTATKKVNPAKPSIGKDFKGVQVFVHPTNKQHFKEIGRLIPGASVNMAENKSGWAVRIVSASSEGHQNLTFFWDAGWNDIKRALTEAGINSEWVEV